MPEPITTGLTAGAAASWLWDKFGKDVTSKTTDAAKQKYKEFKWDAAAEKYRAKNHQALRHDASVGACPILFRSVIFMWTRMCYRNKPRCNALPLKN